MEQVRDLRSDVIALLYDVLGGELTTRSLLKFLTVGVIAGAAFSYYLSDLRVDEKEGSVGGSRVRNPVFLGGATLLVVVAVVAAVAVMGGPGEERVRRLDEKRVQDLTELKLQVDVFWTRQHRLPTSLDEMAAATGGLGTRRDPGTGAPYEYRAMSATEYELCSTFARPSSESATAGIPWTHAAGRQCFPLEATH